ncbi:MAG TPA: copper resistance system multicopper oxidase [Rhodanobacteraceae bacterium]|nr:copper resistance system multicopper oxidase [Rhodanobacteraceae bacterium]
MKTHIPRSAATNPSRRRFVQGVAGATALAGLGLWLPSRARAELASRTLNELRGDQFDLRVGHSPVNFTGRPRQAIAINGSVPGPTLRWKQGQTVRMRVANALDIPTSIHWHGILLPADMDGVPGLSFPGIDAGKAFTYEFRVRQSGTYWYHSHSGLQEQVGLYGAIVIDPAAGERFPADRDYVVMLNDWSDDSPEHILATLKKQSDYYNRAEPTLAELIRDARRQGLGKALAERRMWNRMRMSWSDLSDVTGATYTYLMNGHTPAGNWTGLFQRGEKVRLRFINGSAMTFFDVRIPGLKMTVVATDGQDIEPVTVDEFRIAVAETYDVIVEPADDRAWSIFAQAIDRSGYACGTLAPRADMHAEIPAMDARVHLSMGDMMGAMSHGDAHTDAHSMHAMHDMAGMDMASMNMSAPAPRVRHARTEYDNPAVDMRVDTPRSKLDDPGTGLRDNGRRVLTYADLHTIGGPIDPREPGREIELHLSGNMHRYLWSFDGVPFAEATPIHFRAGERLRMVLVNDTMMNHPIHLHGMWSELENPDGGFQVRKHTVNVQPAQRITYAVSADAMGRWAYHCHMLYHMELGMMREVVVS